MTAALQQTQQHWEHLSDVLYVPQTEQDYTRLVEFLDVLLDEVRESETHPLASLLNLVGELVRVYEDKHIKELA